MTDRIDILVSARNQTSGAFNQIKQDIRGLESAAGAVNQGLSGIGALAGVGAIVAGLQQIGSEMEELARRGAIFNQLDSVLDSYAASVGQVGDAFVEAGRKASAGTIADYDLILNANRALQFEVAKTSDQYGQLIELSTALGRAQGISDTQALEYLTTGIARESRLILDNLGLIIDLDEATSKYAATIGKTASTLTTSERKQALLNAAFEQGATAIAANRQAADSTATQFERLDTSIQRVRDSFGSWLAEVNASNIKEIANAIDIVRRSLEGGSSSNTQEQIDELMRQRRELQETGKVSSPVSLLAPDFQGDAKAQAALYAALTAEIKRLGEEKLRLVAVEAQERASRLNGNALTMDAAIAMGAHATAVEENEAAQRRYAAQSSRTGDALKDLYAALEDASPATKRLAHEMLESGYSVDEVADKVRGLRGELSLLASAGAGAKAAIIRSAAGVASIIGDQAAMDLAKQKTGELDFALSALDQRVQDGTISETELVYETARLNDEFTGTFDAIQEADRAAKAFAREGLSAATKAANEAEQAFNSLQSKVAGVLSESLNLDVGVNLDDILPREDAINEDARRLADVAVKGFDSPWYDYFKNNFPALFQEFFAGAADANGVKMQAAQLLKNFQDGLEPELLDKDKAKDRVRRMLLGEQSMAELAQQIANELSAEFGGSISLGKIQATASAALGVDGGNQVQLAQTLTGVANEATGQAAVIGSNIRTGIVSALDGIGETVAIALDKQFRAENNLKVINEAGRAHGEAWGSGFLATVRDGVPPALVEILASLVGTQLEAIQFRNATLNGAN